MNDKAEPETFERLTIRTEKNGYVIRGERDGRASGAETPCWVAADSGELVALVRRLMATPREDRTT